MKKLCNLITLIVIVSMSLVACSGDATTEAPVVEPTTPPPTEASEEQPTEVVEEPTEAVEEPTAVLRIWADDTRSSILADLAEPFMAEYNVELVVEEVTGIREQVTIAAPAGEGPDIFIGAHDWIGQLIASGLLAPIDLGEKVGEFNDLALKGFTYTDGLLYGMPYATENLGFFYNTDLVPEPPTTWDEVLEIARQLKADEKIKYAFALHGTTYDFMPIQTAFGGYVFGIDDAGNWNSADLGIGSQGTIDAVAWTRSAIEEELIPATVEGDTDVALFETGEAAFLIAGPWFVDRIKESGIPYAVTSFPDGGAPFMGVQGFMVNAFSENTLLAQAFLTEFVATPEVMEELQTVGNRPSALLAALEMSDNPDFPGFGAAGENASLMPYIPEMGSVWAAWGNGVTLAINGDQSAEDAMTEAATQINSLIAGELAGMVNIPGSFQALVGCGGDWDPACEATALTEGDDGMYSVVLEIPAGEYEFKVALDGAWTVNYGSDGAQDGPNYALALDADSTVTFVYDPETNLVTFTAE